MFYLMIFDYLCIYMFFLNSKYFKIYLYNNLIFKKYIFNKNMEKLPKMLQYKTIKPKGFPNEFKRWELLPQASSSNYNLMDVVRF